MTLPEIIGNAATSKRIAIAAVACALVGAGCVRIPAPWSSDKAKAVARAEDKADVARSPSSLLPGVAHMPHHPRLQRVRQ